MMHIVPNVHWLDVQGFYLHCDFILASKNLPMVTTIRFNGLMVWSIKMAVQARSDFVAKSTARCVTKDHAALVY